MIFQFVNMGNTESSYTNNIFITYYFVPEYEGYFQGAFCSLSQWFSKFFGRMMRLHQRAPIGFENQLVTAEDENAP